MPDSSSYAPVADAITVGLVEDDAFFRETVVKLLDTAPEIDCRLACGSCEEALVALEETFMPEVFLMDISLPGMSGIEGIRRLRALSPETHIIMLTVHEDSDRIFEALCAGATGYLLKPSSADRIIDAVRAARGGGAAINPQIASKLLEMFTRLAVPQADYGLTAREREILNHLVDSMTKKRIAESLFVSYHTVDMHIRNIYAKLHVHSRSGAVAKALKERLL